MGQVLHGSATTTHAVRAAIQRSKAPIQELAEQYGHIDIAEVRTEQGKLHLFVAVSVGIKIRGASKAKQICCRRLQRVRPLAEKAAQRRSLPQA